METTINAVLSDSASSDAWIILRVALELLVVEVITVVIVDVVYYKREINENTQCQKPISSSITYAKHWW